MKLNIKKLLALPLCVSIATSILNINSLEIKAAGIHTGYSGTYSFTRNGEPCPGNNVIIGYNDASTSSMGHGDPCEYTGIHGCHFTLDEPAYDTLTYHVASGDKGYDTSRRVRVGQPVHCDGSNGYRNHETIYGCSYCGLSTAWNTSGSDSCSRNRNTGKHWWYGRNENGNITCYYCGAVQYSQAPTHTCRSSGNVAGQAEWDSLVTYTDIVKGQRLTANPTKNNHLFIAQANTTATISIQNLLKSAKWTSGFGAVGNGSSANQITEYFTSYKFFRDGTLIKSGNNIIGPTLSINLGYEYHVYTFEGTTHLGETIKVPDIIICSGIPVTCIDIDITTGKELGRSQKPIDITGYNMVPSSNWLFMPFQTVSATAWGTDVSKDAYYKDYFYKNGSATSRYVPDPNSDHTVYRYFYPTPIFTNQIKIEGTNIYKDPTHDKTYFVKVDTPFITKYTSYIFGSNPKNIEAPNDYRINNQFIAAENGKNSDVYNLEILNAENSKIFSKTSYNLLKLNTETATRNNLKTNLELVSNFQTDSGKDNKLIEITPKATANYNSGKTNVVVKSSDNITNTDKQHNIFVICDSKEPTVVTDKKYDPEDTSFYPLIEDKTTITISYADYVREVDAGNVQYGSGVNTSNIKVTLIQEQTDPEDPIYKGGPMSKVYTKDTVNNIVKITGFDDYTGQIKIDINPAEYSQMSGFITIRVEITDNVGNKLVKDFRILVMHMTAILENTVEASKYYKTTIFAQGENGKIITETNGFIDQVQYDFPPKLDGLALNERSNAGGAENGYWHVGRVLSDIYPHDSDGNPTKVFTNMQTKYWGSENKGGMEWIKDKYEHSFLIHYFYAPLYTPKDDYTVIVTAYKTDPKNTTKVYSVRKVLDFSVGKMPMMPPEVDIPPITEEIRDTINDN